MLCQEEMETDSDKDLSSISTTLGIKLGTTMGSTAYCDTD